MSDSTEKFGKIIRIDSHQVEEKLGEIVRGTVEDTLNQMLDAEADRLCRAKRYERSPERMDTRAGSYKRFLETKAGNEADSSNPKSQECGKVTEGGSLYHNFHLALLCSKNRPDREVFIF